MLIRRIISGLVVAILWFLAMCYMPAFLIFIVLLVMSTLCQREFYGMMKQCGFEVEEHIGIAAGLGWLVLTYVYPPAVLRAESAGPDPAMMLLVAFVFVLFTRILFNKKTKNAVEKAGVTLLGFFYLPVMLSFFIRLAQWGAVRCCEIPDCRTGIFLAAFVALVVKLGDVGAFGVGVAFGKHRMCPGISPKKTWEGFCGGLAASLIVALVVTWMARRFEAVPGGPLEELSIFMVVILAVFLGLIGAVSDLFESMFKRCAVVKDSAGLLPGGMGGILDMFDSLIFTPAVLYWFLLLATG
ncbi:MAG: phosphatidate cytidylyltransferase [Kiritimatiellia bacterium]